MIVGVTGHREERIKGKREEIEKWLDEQIKNLKNCYGDVVLLTGMAQGVDQIAAFNALKNGVDIKCYFGYKHKLHNVEEFLADSAIEVRYECPKFQDDCFFKRDRRIVDDCDLLIVVWDGIEIGGTFFTWKYAVKKGKKILMFPWNKGEQDNRVVGNFDSVEDEFN